MQLVSDQLTSVNSKHTISSADTASTETVGLVHKYHLKMCTDITVGAPHSSNYNNILIHLLLLYHLIQLKYKEQIAVITTTYNYIETLARKENFYL